MADKAKLCEHPECDNSLNKGKKYCSVKCANQDRYRRTNEKKEATVEVEFAGDLSVLRSGMIPKDFEDAAIAGLGYSRANILLSEIEIQMAQSAAGENGTQLALWPKFVRTQYPIGSGGLPMVPRESLKPPTSAGQIQPYSNLVDRGIGNYLADFRRNDDITYDDIDRLLRLGPCLLASRLKKGPIMSALSGKRKWSVDTKNAKLKAVVEANLSHVFLRHTQDMLMAMDYGAAFGSTVWHRATADEIGVKSGVGQSKKWYAIDKIEWAHPSTIVEIERDKKDFSFRGFWHRREQALITERDVIIAPPQALLLTYGMKFGNLWGESIFEPAYDFAFWYEVVMRATLRYLERMGIPVTVMYGPGRGRTKLPDGTVVDNVDYGLLVAGAAATHSALFVPSDVDINTGQPLWRLEYMETDQRGEQFIKILQYLGTQIMRSVIVGDRAATQDSEVGSYNAAEVHNRVTQIDSDYIFKAFVGQLDRYLMRRFAEFNVSATNPPGIGLHAEVLDPVEQETMMKLLATAGNVKIGEGSPMDRINWEDAFKGVHAPILSDEELEEQRKRRIEERKETQEALTPKPAPGQPGQPGQSRPGLPAGKQGGGRNGAAQKARLSIMDHISEGGLVPVMLVPEDAIRLAGQHQDEVDLVGVVDSSEELVEDVEEKETPAPQEPGETDQ
jgi:hypothetical protein